MANIKRLKTLLQHLKTVPAESFNLRYWQRTLDCGTVACACGHACSIPSFREAGLSLLEGGYALRYRNQETGETRYDMNAAAHFFGLSGHEADQLFMQCLPHYMTVDHVIAALTKLISEKEEYVGESEVTQDTSPASQNT